MDPKKISRGSWFFGVFLGFFFLMIFPAGAASPKALPLTANSADFVRVEGDHFSLRAQSWYPNGINYFPLNAIAIPATQVPSPNHWFSPGVYNGSIVEADLALIRSLGMNTLAVGLPTDSNGWGNFVDFLDRCQRHQLRIFLFLPMADPLGASIDRLVEILTDPTLNLPNRPQIFAYDIAWEPHLGDENTRSRWNGVFSRWIASTYRTPNDASQALGYSIPRAGNGYQAGFIRYEMPVAIPAGQTFSGTITVMNTGTVVWNRNQGFRLGLKNAGEGRFIMPRDVNPGEEVSIPVSFAVPFSPGRYRYYFGMVQEMVRWFGDLDIEVEVTAPGASEVRKAVNLPTPMMGPTDYQLMHDGQWRPFVQAYRRAIDTEVSRRYGEVVRLIKSYAPYQLVSARQGYGGNGSGGETNIAHYPLDLASTGAHFDFLCPEGYEIGLDPNFTNYEGSRNYIRSGMATTTAYARWASRGKPVVWVEFGYDLYRRAYNSYDPYNPPSRELSNQQLYYSLFLDALLEAGADGSAGWWYAGGIRLDEVSDYGIVNPSRGARPACSVYIDRANALISPRPIRPNAPAYSFDLLGGVRGYTDIYGPARSSALQALNQGQRFVMQPQGTGTTSDSNPITRIGGGGPTRDLRAEISQAELRIGIGGPWFRVMPGGVYAIPQSIPIYVRAKVRNLGPAEWMAGDNNVKFAVNENLSGFGFRWPIPQNISRLEELSVPEMILTQGLTQDADVQFQMVAEGRTWIDGALRLRLVTYMGNGGCQSTCQAGARQCASDNVFQVCGDYDNNGCMEWSPPQSCPTGQVCQGGQCVAACQSTCQAGARQCASGNTYQVCGDSNGDGCLEWAQSQTCGAGQVCQDGQCILSSQCRSGEMLIGGQCSPIALLKAKKGADMSSLPCPAGYQLAGSWLTGIGKSDGLARGVGYDNSQIDSGVMWLCSADKAKVYTVIAWNDCGDSRPMCQGQIHGAWHVGDGCGAQISGADFNGNRISSGWLGLCVSSNAGAKAEVAYNDCPECGSQTGCGSWRGVGAWKPDPGSCGCENGRPKATIGSGASGGLISSGWMGICMDAR